MFIIFINFFLSSFSFLNNNTTPLLSTKIQKRTRTMLTIAKFVGFYEFSNEDIAEEDDRRRRTCGTDDDGG
jgi:hypothetical protein